MVFFTCNACGESVKKVQVEKHVAVCRNCECLSCIDCGKDFWGDDYKNHVKCISEDQKYGGKGFEGKTHKGDVKQQAWLQKINELLKRSNVSPKVKELLEQISGFDNVPRKKAKFQNWMKNSLKVHSEAVLEQVWSIVSEASGADLDGHQKPPGPVAHPSTDSSKTPSSGADEMAAKPTEGKKNKRERKEERQKNRKKEKKELKLENHQENGKGQKAKKRKLDPVAEAGGEAEPRTTGPTGKKKRKGQQAVNGGPSEDGAPKASAGKRKRRHSEAAVPVEVVSKKKKAQVPGQAEDGEAANHTEAPAQGKFNWKGTIKALLKQAPDNELAVKKLRKKVLSQYHAVSGEQHLSEEELLATFSRKISKNPSLKLLKDKVKLLK